MATRLRKQGFCLGCGKPQPCPSDCPAGTYFEDVPATRKRAVRFTGQLAKKDVSKVLSQEITWHRKHRGTSGCSDSFENGFIAGIKQARSLVRKMKGAEV